jgi:glycosyltransferase involved in cell wall biosynthesis
MRLGIDATYLLEPRKSGVETYTLNLIRSLLSLPERPEVFLYAARGGAHPEDALPLIQAADRARVSRIPRLWLRLRMPVLMKWDGVEVAHFPGTILPAWLPCPAVVTFYDLAALRYPDLYDPAELGHYENLIPSAARRSAAVLAISECTKRDLVEHFGIPPAKVFATPLGVDSQFRPVPDAAVQVEQRFGLRRPYILACVGSGHPRKNLKAVIDAFSRLSRADLALAIVGAADRDQQALGAARASPASDRIVRLGHVAEEHLPLIYSAATVFCFPSLYEGFGLPVLEAMACGTAVVCANTSSLPETAGDAALLVDPKAPDDLDEALGSLLEDVDRRKSLVARGLEHAKQFTWARTAELTLGAYEAAAGGPS